jgi:RNA polymerase sigma-70 factor, ECF subfamily
MLKESTDFELIDALRVGNSIAEEELYSRYHTRVVSTCCHYLRSSDDGQDAAQEVFFKILVLKKILDFRGESSFWTWLRRVVINVCKEFIRKLSRIREVCLRHSEQLSPLEEVIPAQENNPEEDCIQAEENQRIHDVVNQLPEKYSSAILSTYMEELSYAESAKKLNLTIQGLGVRLLRGRKMLAQLFQKRFRLHRHATPSTEQANLDLNYLAA